MYHLAALSGAIQGSLYDPLNWGLVAFAATIGFRASHWAFPLVLAAIFTAVNAALVYGTWKQLGVAVPARTMWMLEVKTVMAYVAFGIGHAVRWMVRQAT